MTGEQQIREALSYWDDAEFASIRKGWTDDCYGWWILFPEWECSEMWGKTIAEVLEAIEEEKKRESVTVLWEK